VLIGWLRESRPVEAQVAAGWSGVQSIPRLLGLNAQNRLTMRPIPEVERLRGRHYSFTASGTDQQSPLDVRGMALDIVAEFAPAPDGVCGFSLCASPDGSNRVDVRYEASRQCLVIADVRDGNTENSPPHYREVAHALAADEPLRLRILLDGSVLEVMANDRTSFTHRHYPVQRTHDWVHVRLHRTTLRSLEVWEMSTIWDAPTA
jgi:beta-fructofuranosidase